MKQIAAAFFVLLIGLLACARTGKTTSSSSTTTTIRSITFDGIERKYILHIPASYDGSHAVPLVFAFHGGAGNANNQERVSGFDALSDEKGLIVAYPDGTGRLGDIILTWNGGTCCGYAVTNNIDDVGFVRALIKDLQSIVRIDVKRVYATGLSNGGIMSYRLACEASDLIAAIGPVSGTQNIAPCTPSQPVSVIDFHGTADEHLPYNGGVGDKSLARVPSTSVKDSIDFWVRFDQCHSTPETESFDDIRHDTYSGCANGTAVELYTIIGGKHAWPGSDGPAWPGGDQPTQTISATKLMWNFFTAHPKP